MLVPEVWPPPKRTKHIGRWQIVKAGIATETQVAFLTPREARDLAQAAQVADPDGMPPQPRTGGPVNSGPPTQAASPKGQPPVSHVSQMSYVDDEQGEQVVSVTADAVTDHEQVRSTMRSVRSAVADHEEPVEAQRLVGLREAVEEGIVGKLSIFAVRQARQRNSHRFPRHVTMRGKERLYDAEELGRWARNLPHADTGEPAAGISDAPPWDIAD
jgi:hypothetical protein